jgi:hypothetical protein
MDLSKVCFEPFSFALGSAYFELSVQNDAAASKKLGCTKYNKINYSFRWFWRVESATFQEHNSQFEALAGNGA